MDVTQLMLGLGGGLLLGTLVDLAGSRTQWLLASLGVALVACGGAVTLFTQGLEGIALAGAVGLVLPGAVTAASRVLRPEPRRDTAVGRTG